MRPRNPLAVALLAIAMLLVAGTNWPESTAAATVTATWRASIAVPGASPKGTATFYVYEGGTGLLSLKLRGLTPGASYWVGLYSGTCSKPAAWIVNLRVVAPATNGTVTRGLTLSAAMTARLRTLAKGKLSVAIGSLRRCGTLIPALTVTPTPIPTPVIEASPLPNPTPQPTPLPTMYVY